MVRVIVVVRETGRLKPDYSLEFEVPEVPRSGDYISIQRPDHPDPWGEDLIVRQVWWRLDHTTTSPVQTGKPATGKVREIFVECDPAIGPYSSDDWLRLVGPAVDAGKAERLQVARVDVRESMIKP